MGSDEGTGIFSCPPMKCGNHSYRESVQMGQTELSDREVIDLLKVLAKDWPGSSYDVLRRNCCHFGDELCRWLAVGAIPDWITSAADAAHKVSSAGEKVKERRRSLKSFVVGLCACRRVRRKRQEKQIDEPTPLP